MDPKKAKLEALKRLNQKMVDLRSNTLKGKPSDSKQVSILMMMGKKDKK